MSEPTRKDRLESLDILRGFDLFMLVILAPLLWSLNGPMESSWYSNMLQSHFNHVSWEGFALWDLVMPLFMFMSGITIPFALSRYRDGRAGKSALYGRLFRRVALLWILGMLVQGALLSFSIPLLKPFSNTLQAIAVGYFFSSLIFVYFSRRVQYAITVVLLLLFWAIMMFVTVDGFGGGNFSPDYNLAEWIDRSILGGARDGAVTIEGGEVIFASNYHYTWILSSINFIVTVMSGTLVGDFLKNSRLQPQTRAIRIALVGLLLTAGGWVWDLQMPVIKTIWSSSMVLVSSGYCLLLLALFYWVIDCKGWKRWAEWLKIFGMNSILAYVLSESPLNLKFIPNWIIDILGVDLGVYAQFAVIAAEVVLMTLILWIFYRKRIFLKV